MFHPEVFEDDGTFNKFMQLYLLHHTFRNETIQSYHNGRSPTFDYNLNNKIYDNIEHKYDKTRRNKNIKHTIDITINLNNQEEETRQDARVKYKQIYDRIRQRIHKQFPSLPSEKNPQLPNPTPSSNNNPTQSHDKSSKEKYPQLPPGLPDDPFKPESPITSNGKIKPRKITNLKQIDDYLKQQEKQIKRHHRQIQKNLDNCVSWRREMMKTKNKPQYKRWNWTPNDATRHTCNDGQIVPLEEKFIIINDKTGDLDYMDYPGDWSASASNTINCLCDITFTDDPKGAEDYPKFKKLQQEKSTQIKQDNQYKKIAKEYVHDKDYIPEGFSKNAMESIWNFQKKYGEKNEEYGAIYDYKTGKKLIKKDFKGNSGSVRIPFDDITSDTAFSIHNHPPDGYPAPSGQDIYKLIITEKEKRSVIVNNKNIFIVKENKDITKEKVEKIREQLNQIPKEYKETYKKDRLKVDESIEKEFNLKIEKYKQGHNWKIRWDLDKRRTKQIKRNHLKDKYDEEYIKRCMNLLLKENIEIHRIIKKL